MKFPTPIKAAFTLLSLVTSTVALPSCAQETPIALPAAEAAPKADFSAVPGSVIAQSPSSSRLFIGSPGIVVLPNGTYLAKNDEFGFGIENTRAITRVWSSSDQGQSWQALSAINGSFWSSIFTHRDAVYLLGTDKQYGNVVIHRSDDGGKTWTKPTDASNGVLRSDGKFHCAPMPVIEHRGRLWRAMEDAGGPGGWGHHFRAFMMSAPIGSDLLDAKSWTSSNSIARDAAWNGGDFNGWLEGNAVVAPSGKIVDILRVDTKSPDEKAAVIQISDDGKTASFDAKSGFVAFPGGAKKFTIRFDPQSKTYWSLANVVLPRHKRDVPGSIRNTLALTSSPDLKTWTTRSVLLYHPDVARHGFQYIDWQFDGNDLVFAARTAFDDGVGGAPNNHDANFLTFHRAKNFRSLTMKDSVPMPEAIPVRVQTRDFTISGQSFGMTPLVEGLKTFSNRNYVWLQVPGAFKGGSFTRVGGGERATILVKAKRNATLSVATALSQPGFDLKGWTKTRDVLSYNDGAKTQLTLFTRALKAGEEISITQGNWTGTLVIVPADEG